MQTVDCKTDLFVVCEGKCYRTFHAACVGLTETSVYCLSGNILWLCNDCVTEFRDRQRKQQPASSHQEETVLRSISGGLDVITSKIAELTQMISAVDIKETRPQLMSTNASQTISANASQLSQNLMESAPSQSTPIRCQKLQKGSRIDTSLNAKQSALTHSSKMNRMCQSEDTFSLFLTNIDGRVAEDEISTMVSQSLGIDESNSIGIIKLVSRWKKDNCDYASFRVMLHDQYRKKALQASTWPVGVMYREFYERPRIAWKPI